MSVTPLLGKELNKRYRVNDDVLTPDEIVAVGLIYVPEFPYETEDGEIIEETVRKSMLSFDHEWPDEIKKQAKDSIIKELKERGCKYIKKIFIVPFADDMDYSGFSFNVRILIQCGKRKT